jgi:hypothetical protein
MLSSPIIPSSESYTKCKKGQRGVMRRGYYITADQLLHRPEFKTRLVNFVYSISLYLSCLILLLKLKTHLPQRCRSRRGCFHNSHCKYHLYPRSHITLLAIPSSYSLLHSELSHCYPNLCPHPCFVNCAGSSYRWLGLAVRVLV